jgi:AbrB family looped-hinge helix DNA binding protein
VPYFYPMGTLTVTAKGQVTLRKDVLEHLGVGPGEQIDVTKLPDGKIEVRAASTGDISSLFGMLTKKGRPPLSIDAMNEITKQGWSGRVDRKK